ncbi:phosphatidylinositol phosphatase PTPRQ-like [Saccostrea cucullata]|uniref:phosphatidylinositol phosphatase PTPRQ-like n=1 Tax=Saccostrea cuccullata TaxID=36930 RepID=UPI002ED49743
MNTAGAVQYKITLNKKSLLQSTDPIYQFTDLLPGMSYTAKVEAIGKENLTSQIACNLSTFTRPSDPVCKNVIVYNLTTTALGIDLAKVHTNRAKNYFAEYNDTKSRLNATWNESNSFRKQFTDLTPGKQYKFSICAISENHLKSSRCCIVSKYTRPIPPSNITNITIGTYSFTIHWNPPPSAVVGSYKVTANCICPCTARVTHSGLDTEAQISDLPPGTHCSVTIISISGGLRSDPLYYPDIKTKEPGPGKVSDFTVVEIKTGGFGITWNEPENPNGDILSYSIMITDSSGSNPTNVSSTTRNHTFENLSAGSCYNVSIGAVNHAGEGVKETKTVYTSETVPSKVTNLTAVNSSSTSITVKWSKPLNPNGVIIRYVLTVLKDTEEKKCVRVEFNCTECQKPCPYAEVMTVSFIYKFQNQGLYQLFFISNLSNMMKLKMLLDIHAIQADTEQTDEKLKESYSGCNKHSSSFGINNVSLIYEVTALDIFTSYSVTMQAYTSEGGGADSTTDIRTSADKPSTPGKPLPTKDIFSMSFVYNRPMEINGLITHQEIEYTHKPYKICSSEETPNQTTEKKEISIQEEDNNYTFSLENLKPFWKYKVRVRVRTYAGYSNYSEEVRVQTLPTTPGNVSEIMVINKTSRGMLLMWTQPCYPNGNIINYKIIVQNKNDSINKTTHTNSSKKFYLIHNLLPYRLYTFTILTEVANVTQKSAPAKSETFRTLSEAPFKPGNITFVVIKASSLRVSWNPPILQTGPTRYEASAIDEMDSTINFTCRTQGFGNTNCIITGLDAYWRYSLVVRVFTDNFEPNYSASQFTTAQSAPGRVEYFSVKQDENIAVKSNVLIEWKPPVKRDLNGIIQIYFIQFWYLLGEKMVMSYSSNTREVKIEVKPEETYTFQIFAMTVENATEENYYTDKITIKPGAPLPLPPQKTPVIQQGSSVSNEQKQLSIAFSLLALCYDRNGEITQWFVIVSKESKGSTGTFIGGKANYYNFIQKHYQTWRDVYENDNRHTYVASDSWKPNCVKSTQNREKTEMHTMFTLGSEGDCSNSHKYCNGYLEPGKKYWVRYAICTRVACLESEYSSQFTTAPNNVPVIAGSVSAVILVALIVVIIVAVFHKRKKKGPLRHVYSDCGEIGQPIEIFPAVEMGSTLKEPNAVKIADFASYVKKLHANSNLFSKEYKVLKENSPTHTTKAAELQVNRIKNRYLNILAYDHSRVKLLSTEYEGSDYINASYIPGLSSQREYIATQGPLPFTRDEFWRMIWEQNVTVVVMLTRLVERGRRKCDIYWPGTTRETVHYGDLVVETESESIFPDYILRVMSVKLGGSRKTVKQFCYLAWPDMGIPETSKSMLKFTKEVRSHLPLPSANRGPLVVHCSAGVGPTGTFIAVDYLMQHVTSSDVVDIYHYVMKMRNNRPNMVQTEDQYIFIHDCIRDFINRSDHDSDGKNIVKGDNNKRNLKNMYSNM